MDSNPFDISQDSAFVNSFSGNQLAGGAGKQSGFGGLYPFGMGETRVVSDGSERSF